MNLPRALPAAATTRATTAAEGPPAVPPQGSSHPPTSSPTSASSVEPRGRGAVTSSPAADRLAWTWTVRERPQVTLGSSPRAPGHPPPVLPLPLTLEGETFAHTNPNTPVTKDQPHVPWAPASIPGQYDSSSDPLIPLQNLLLPKDHVACQTRPASHDQGTVRRCSPSTRKASRGSHSLLLQMATLEWVGGPRLAGHSVGSGLGTQRPVHPFLLSPK